MIKRGVNGTEGDFAAGFDDVGEAAGRGIENKSDNNGVRSEMSWGRSTPAQPSQIAAKRGSRVGRDMRAEGSGSQYASMERKARMTALTPIVFHSAFVDHDPLALDILQNASAAVARLIARNLAPLPSSPQASVSIGESFEPSMPIAASSVLCLGGSLVGVQAYRALVLEHLRRMGHVFPHVEFVKDAAEAGVLRLAAMFGKEMAGTAGEDVAKTAKGNGNSAGFEASHVSA